MIVIKGCLKYGHAFEVFPAIVCNRLLSEAVDDGSFIMLYGAGCCYKYKAEGFGSYEEVCHASQVRINIECAEFCSWLQKILRREKMSVKKCIRNLFVAITMSLILAGIVPSLPYEATSQFSTVEAATKVKLNKSKATLIKGQTLQLKMSGTKKKATWSSSNKKIATVSSNGKVTAKAKGTATITAKVSGKKYTCKITVETPKINKTSLTLNAKKSYTLKVTGTTQKITWKSSNTSIASVNAKGKVTAKKAGKATITAAIGNKKYSCKLTVKPAIVSVTSVKLNASSRTIEVGDTISLKATVSPSNATNKAVTWSSSNTSVATVSSSGVVKGKAAGTATITVKTKDGGKKYTCKVKVINPEPTMADYYAELKTYIKKYGYTNSSGNKFISKSVYSGGTEFTYGIVYETRTDTYSFIMTMDNGTSQSSVAMDVNVLRDDYVYPEFIYVYEDAGAAFRTEACFSADLYYGQDVTFTITGTTGHFSTSTMRELSNTALQLAFTEWNALLLDTVGITLYDLGFTSYL